MINKKDFIKGVIKELSKKYTVNPLEIDEKYFIISTMLGSIKFNVSYEWTLFEKGKSLNEYLDYFICDFEWRLQRTKLKYGLI